MAAHTDSHIIEYNDDNTRTETTVVTYAPTTTTQKALAWTGLLVVVLAPAAPLIIMSAYEKYEEKRDARKAAKQNLKSV